jgi:hypothetical protein
MIGEPMGQQAAQTIRTRRTLRRAEDSADRILAIVSHTPSALRRAA